MQRLRCQNKAEQELTMKAGVMEYWSLALSLCAFLCLPLPPSIPPFLTLVFKQIKIKFFKNPGLSAVVSWGVWKESTVGNGSWLAGWVRNSIPSDAKVRILSKGGVYNSEVLLVKGTRLQCGGREAC